MKKIKQFLLAEDLQVYTLFKCSFSVTDNLNYWYKPGTNGILLVSHVDTITRCNSEKHGQKKRELELTEFAGIIRATGSVLGADDRSGCFAISEILKDKELRNCGVLLTNFEEAGGKGVKRFIQDHPQILNTYKIFVEIDREGVDQFTHYMEEIDPLINDLCEQFNFNFNQGSYSDVADLSRHYKIPHVNLSAGYYNQHTKWEYLDYLTLSNILIPRYIELIKAFIMQETLEYIVPAPRIKYQGYSAGTQANWGGMSESFAYFEDPLTEQDDTFERQSNANVDHIIDKVYNYIPLKPHELISLSIVIGTTYEKLCLINGTDELSQLCWEFESIKYSVNWKK